MAFDIESRDPNVIAVSGEMNIYAAREAAERLLPLLNDCAEPTLDLSQVSEFDCTGLQLLLMANRSAQAAGKALRLVDVSAPVREALDLLQCDELRSTVGACA